MNVLRLPFLFIFLFYTWTLLEPAVVAIIHLLLHLSSNLQSNYHACLGRLLRRISPRLHQHHERKGAWHHWLWYILVPGPLLSSMSRFTLLPLPELHHFRRRRWHVHVDDGYDQRRVLRLQRPMATDDGILYSTKLRCRRL